MTNRDIASRYESALEREADSVRVSSTVGQVVFDFDRVLAEDLPLLERLNSGQYGSSIVLDTANGEVETATFRMGEADIPDSDLAKNAALPWLEEAVMDTRPPVDVDVRWRHWGPAILHIVVNDRADAEAFLRWYQRLERDFPEAMEDVEDRTWEVFGDGA
jgi:hypothetical protein